MIVLQIKEGSIIVLEAEKSYLGKTVVRQSWHTQVTSSEPWEDKVPELLRNKQITLVLPDSRVFIHRFEIPSGFIGPALESIILTKASEIIPVQGENLIYTYRILPASLKQESQTILFMAVPSQVLSEFATKIKSLGSKITFATSESFSFFQIVREDIKPGETIVHIDIGFNTSSLSFIDKNGPILTFSEPMETIRLETDVKDVIQFFKDKYGPAPQRIFVSGENENGLRAEVLEKSLQFKIVIVKIEDVLPKILIANKASFENTNPPQEVVVSALGASMLAYQNDSMNLADNAGFEKMLSRPSKNFQNQEKNGNNPDTENKTLPASDISRTGGKPHMQVFGQSDTKKRPLFLLFILVLLLISLTVVLTQKKSVKQIRVVSSGNRVPSRSVSRPLPSPVVTLQPTLAINRQDLKIQVLNGTDISGRGAKTAQMLEGKGYKNVAVGNATNSNYQKTVIQIKNAKKQYVNVLVQDLQSDYSVSSSIQTLDDASPYDAIVTVGSQ